MRYQERIYIQNDNRVIRNKDILNVNMSSDMCIFETPSFTMTGASKIDCTASTSANTYIVSASTDTIPLTFNFTGNTDSFSSTDAQFKFEIYKYEEAFSAFSTTPKYQSNLIEYSAFSATNTTSVTVPIANLSIDGEYLIKGSYRFKQCTDFFSRLGTIIDTSNYLGGNDYGIYNKDLDYYFIAFTKADTPILTQNDSTDSTIASLMQSVILPDVGTTQVVAPNLTNGMFLLTLNGLVLSPDLDYTLSGNIVTLAAETVEDDMITFIYTNYGGNSLTSDNFEITSIPSGPTNGEGNNSVYYNTDTNKYELFTSVIPINSDSIIVMLNGMVLANGIDFYQSTSNPKRIILEGYLVVGDIITIVYFPSGNVVNGVNTNAPIISWKVSNAPKNTNGNFLLQVGDVNFTSLYYTGLTDYVVGVTDYSHGFVLTGSVGTEYYYRVRNIKNYTTICGNDISSTAYSETVPIIIQSNSINSY